MKAVIAKIAGYPAIIVLGAFAIERMIAIAPYLMIPLLGLYLPVIVILASDSALYRMPFGYQVLEIVLLATAVWWLQIWVLNLGFFLALFAMAVLNPDRVARNKRIRAWIRGLSHSA